MSNSIKDLENLYSSCSVNELMLRIILLLKELVIVTGGLYYKLFKFMITMIENMLNNNESKKDKRLPHKINNCNSKKIATNNVIYNRIPKEINKIGLLSNTL